MRSNTFCSEVARQPVTPYDTYHKEIRELSILSSKSASTLQIKFLSDWQIAPETLHTAFPTLELWGCITQFPKLTSSHGDWPGVWRWDSRAGSELISKVLFFQLFKQYFHPFTTTPWMPQRRICTTDFVCLFKHTLASTLSKKADFSTCQCSFADTVLKTQVTQISEQGFS